MATLSAHHARQLLRPVAHQLVSLVFRQKAQLAPERLLAEYRQGRFPMAGRLGRLTWHDPEMRAIMPLDERFHVPGDVRKLLRKEHFTVSFNRAFRQVIQECSAPMPGRESSWITPEIVAAYTRLYELGYANSVEVWNGDRLVGGGYGVNIGGFFSGESMFFRENHASKFAMYHVVNRLRERGFVLLDAQMVSNLSLQFGVIEIPRAEYKALLAQALATDAHF